MAEYNFSTSTIETKEGQRSLLSRSFLYMFLFLLLTAGVSLLVHVILNAAGGGKIANQTYQILLITASITQLVLTFIIAFSSLKSGKGVLIPMILYATCMGVLISGFGFVLNWYTLAVTFAIAACAFGGMALIGVFSKNASGLGMVGMGLLFSALMVGLFNGLMFFFAPSVWAVQNIVVSIIVVIAICLITAYDVYNIKRVSEAGVNAPNLALYFAFNLYMDFIIILIRLLQLAVIFSRDN